MARKIKDLTPSAIDVLSKGCIPDSQTPGLSIAVLGSGKKVWRYYRRLQGRDGFFKRTLGQFPAHSIADARARARVFNEQIEAGVDPREVERAEAAERAVQYEVARAAALRATMTVARAHELYMVAVEQGRASRAKRKNKPRTITDKLYIYATDIAPALADRVIYDVSERDLVSLVQAKGERAQVRANRLAAELKVFFGWATSLRGTVVGLESDPSRRLGDLRFPEEPRSRKLSLEEIEWFLCAVAQEECDLRRGMILWLLTAARISEVVRARADEVVDGVWTVPASRAKNSMAHRIALGPWGQRLMRTNNEWVFPAERVDGPRRSGWYKARDRVHDRMEKLAGRKLENFTPHDFRRTARSNTKRLDVDFETAEAMMNHVKKGLERTYDLYELEEEKRAWFLRWENEILGLARKAGVADLLGCPAPKSANDNDLLAERGSA
ncbi:tyrosine-type recombinase/integrase [Sphingomonas sp. Sphisp140]|uniref:tyrosine-type recombinase/integrase n=1 Tax=unclassified Sphingomonas TaxID=196159 RepID=UPI0039B00CEB